MCEKIKAVQLLDSVLHLVPFVIFLIHSHLAEPLNACYIGGLSVAPGAHGRASSGAGVRSILRFHPLTLLKVHCVQSSDSHTHVAVTTLASSYSFIGHSSEISVHIKLKSAVTSLKPFPEVSDVHTACLPVLLKSPSREQLNKTFR